MARSRATRGNLGGAPAGNKRTKGKTVSTRAPVRRVPRRWNKPEKGETGSGKKVSLHAHENGGKGPARRTAVSEGGNDDLRVGKVKETSVNMRRNAKPPDESCQNGAQLSHIDVLVWAMPREGLHITPTPPLGRKGLAGKGGRVAEGGDQAKVVAPMRLTRI